MKQWIPIILFLVSLAQLAPANLCLCRLLPCTNNASSLSGESLSFCIEEDSCPCHEEKDSPPCRSEKNQSSHSCPFDQSSVVSDYAGPKKLLNFETGSNLEFNEFNPVPQILSAQKESNVISNHTLPPVPLYLRLQSILI
ncbi:MAG: hypothetical protein EBT92_15520 [Planctomycetes bacterium]|nr:hypothetical protein [Planctomycetota bacterium]NBY01349.1 hypothetical protein [Planctomycetota bacterium]